MLRASVGLLASVALLIPDLGVAKGGSRVEKYSVGPITMTMDIVGCEGFDVKSTFTFEISGALHFDADGTLFMDILHLKPVGRGLYFNSTDPNKTVLGSPAEREFDRTVYVDGELSVVNIHGPTFMITVPGHGRIFSETGTLVLDYSTGNPVITFSSGLNQFYDQDGAALCNYLK